jgi:hypothetical protein
MSASLQADLKAEIEEINVDSDRWTSDLCGGFMRIRKRVTTLGHNAKHTKVAQLRPIASVIERELSAYKGQQRQQFDALATIEFGLEEALQILEKRFEGWLLEPTVLFKPLEAAGGSSGSRSRGSSPAPQTSALNPAEDPEIIELRSALKTLETEVERAGGMTGGWGAADHEVFTRIARIFKMETTPAFFKKVEERMPHMSKSKLADHARWFVEHEQRQATKRRLLARWRERCSELERKAADEKERLVTEENLRQQQATSQELRQRSETKRRLADWRSRRADEEEFMVEKQRREEEELARYEREQKRQQLQQRQIVEDYRRSREAHQRAREQREQEEHAAVLASRRALSQDDKQRIARRNMDALRRKLQAQGVTPGAAIRAPSPSSRSSRGGYEHIDSRLYDTTASFMQKTRAEPPIEEAPELAAMEPNFRGGLRRAASVGPRIDASAHG